MSNINCAAFAGYASLQLGAVKDVFKFFFKLGFLKTHYFFFSSLHEHLKKIEIRDIFNKDKIFFLSHVKEQK